MFYHIFYPLRQYISGLNLFGYITFRSASAAILSLLISLFIGPVIINFLKKKQIGEEIREEGPAHHKEKAGTPTMGGIIILISLVVPTILFARLDNLYVLLILLATVWGGAIGLLDDYLKVVKKMPKGLIGRYKIVGQVTLGLIVGAVLYFHPEFSQVRALSTVPFFKNVNLYFGVLYIPVIVFVITATSNSVNLTDGLDGLAIGLVGITAAAWAAISYVSGRVDFSHYLNILYLPGAGELTVYSAALIGACLGFLWWNVYPSKVFMGDTGSLSLGCAVGTLAVLLHKELLLIIIGGVFVAESLSVIIQVFYFKRTGGKRIFRMAPIHHHFELKGWHETQVVVRFWIIGILLIFLALSTFKVR